ncbi:TPA: hypothetical protein JBG64_05585 [Legionella pneumophila]|nr:hypothetical protein [Legionella pneumophila]
MTSIVYIYYYDYYLFRIMAHDKTFFSQQAHSSLTLVNYVHHDGIGDFRHLLDFVSFFNNTPVLKEIELICIVINSHKPGNPQSVYIKEQLESMNVAHKILIHDSINGHENLRQEIKKNRPLRKQLQHTIGIIDIALNTSYKLVIQAFCKDKPPTITIAEIDLYATYDQPSLTSDPEKRIDKSRYQADHVYIMGLGKGKVGLKLTGGLFNSPQKAREALQQLSDKRIKHLLLGQVDEEPISQETIDAFLQNNHFIPGYLQDIDTIFGFISIFATNHKLNAERKNLIFYLNNYQNLFKKNYYDEDTGRRYSQFTDLLFDKHFPWHNVFANSGIRSITIYNYAGQKPTEEEITLNPEGQQITIITGIMLNDSDYQLLYDIPQHFVAASGDNTLENAINHGLLFLMQYKYQYETVREIAKIAERIKDTLGFNEEEIREFHAYFGEAHHLISYSNEKSTKARALLQSIDLIRLSSNMRKVCAYLIENENFLHQLPEILQTDLLNISKPGMKQ